MDKDQTFKLTGPEFQEELLTRMGYQEHSPQCENCKFYSAATAIGHCGLNLVMTLNVRDCGYCMYHQKTGK